MPYRQRLPASLAPLTELDAAALRHDSWDNDADRLMRALDQRRAAT
jgi:hypothetical protein